MTKQTHGQRKMPPSARKFAYYAKVERKIKEPEYKGTGSM